MLRVSIEILMASRSSLPRHIKLIEECQAENNLKVFTTYSLNYKPSANDSNVYAKLEIPKWNSDYGKSAVLVVDFF